MLPALLIGATGAAGNAAARLEPLFTAGGTYAYGVAPEIEDLFRCQVNELDNKKREALLHQTQEIVADGVLVAPLYLEAFPWGAGSRVDESPAGLIEGFPLPAPSSA